jgi:Fic family protein
MNKTPALQRDGSLRAENDIRLRINLLEGQSSSIARMLAKAILDHNEAAFNEYTERLAVNRDRVEELLWVLGETAGQSVLDQQVEGKNSMLSVNQAIEKLKAGEPNGEKRRATDEKRALRAELKLLACTNSPRRTCKMQKIYKT